MQPAWQSPQPTVKRTMKAPTPDAGATSYHLDWPMRFGSLGPMPANCGLAATTAATACSPVVTGPMTPPLGVGGSDGPPLLDDGEPLEAAEEHATRASATKTRSNGRA